MQKTIIYPIVLFLWASSLTAGIDIDQSSIEYAKKHVLSEKINFICDDFLKIHAGTFDVVTSLDVIEHIPKEDEDRFMAEITNHLSDTGFCIVGTPNTHASPYASEGSQIGHINLYDAPRLKQLMLKHFNSAFIFSMNDEVVHTGFHNLAHYIFCIGTHKKMN